MLGYGYFVGLILLLVLIPPVYIALCVILPDVFLRLAVNLLLFWWLVIPALAAFFGGAVKALMVKAPEPSGFEFSAVTGTLTNECTNCTESGVVLSNFRNCRKTSSLFFTRNSLIGFSRISARICSF